MDRARIGTFNAGGRFTSVYDLNDGTNSAFVRDTFDIKPHDETVVWSKANRRYGGSKKAAEMHDNGSIEMEFYLGNGSTLVQAMQRFDAMVAVVEDAATHYYFEWRPDGATRSVYYDLRGLGPWDPMYRWIEVSGTKRLHIKLSLQVAPLALGDPMDVYDDFSVDTFTAGDYTADAGAFANTPIVNGVVTAALNLTTENRFTHTARGYSHPDGQYTIKSAPGATITNYKAGRYFKTASTTYLEVYVSDNGTNSQLRIDKVVSGGRTQLVTPVNLASRIVAGTPLWVRARIEGNVIYAEHFTTLPTPMSAPTTTTSYTLTPAEAALFGAGIAGTAGVVWTPQHAAATLDDYTDEPYTYRNLTLPDEMALFGVPGTAPALADAWITPSGGSSAPFFALIGWTPRPKPWNMIWNGDFEVANLTSGWTTAAVTNLSAAATSIAISLAQAKYGTRSADVTTISTNANSGAAFKNYRRFRRGLTYTAKAWVRSSTSVATVQLKVGNSTANDTAVSGATALSTTWQELSVTWTPSADRSDAHLAVIRPTTGANDVFQIDGVRLYEGTVEPTQASQSEGRGAFPPFGVIESENGLFFGQNFSVQASAGASGGSYLGATGVQTAGSQAAGSWAVDPSLMVPDDFTGELSIEVWARVLENPSLTFAQYTLNVFGVNGSGGTGIYTLEWGSDGYTVSFPANDYRFTRLGTLVLPIDAYRPDRWIIHLEQRSFSSGISVAVGTDSLLLVPSRMRASSPSGKDQSSQTYPRFTQSTGEITRVIKTDLSGYAGINPYAAQREPGLGGSPIEIPTGNVQALVKLSSQVPDDFTTTPANTEQLSHSATVHFAVWPRYHLARSS